VLPELLAWGRDTSVGRPYREVFSWVLGVLADRGLLKGQRIAIDATTLEANAAMRSIVRRDTGESYEEFLRGLAKASGIATPTREELVRLDRKRKKRMSNKEWKSPGGRGCADHEGEGWAHPLSAQGGARRRPGTRARRWRSRCRARIRATRQPWTQRSARQE
jgi:hypothetical protein